MSEEKTPETISLGEFLKTASERPTAELWAWAEQYPQLAPALEEIKKQCILGSPDEARNALLGALSRTERELPSQVKNTAPAPEGSAAVPRRVAYVESITQSITDEKKKVRRAFAGQLTRNFINQTGVQVAEEKKRILQDRLTNRLVHKKITTDAARGALIASIEDVPELKEVISQKPAIVEAALKNEQPVLRRIEHVENVIDEAALTALNDQASSPKPDVFLAIAAEKATYTNEPVDRIVQQSAGLARAAVAVNANISDLGDLSRSGKFFQSFAKSGAAKAVAPAADALFDIVARINPPAAKAFVESVIDRSLARVTGTIEQTTKAMVDRIGQTAAQSGLLQTTLKNWNQQIIQQQSTTGGVVKARSVFDDIAGTIFGKSIDEGVFSYAELVQRRLVKGEHLPAWQQIHVVGIVQHQPHLVHFAPISGVGGWALSWLSNTIAQKTGGKVASAVVGTAAKEAGKRAAAAVLTKLGLSALVGTASGGVSLMIQAAVQGGLWLGGKIMGLAGFLFSGQWITNLLSSTGKSDWRKDQPLILAAGAIILLIALFLFPWFFNFNYMNDLVNKEALVPGLGGAVRPGPEGSGYIKITKTPSQESFPDNIPGDVTYTIILQANGATLSNINISDSFSVFGGSKTISAPAPSGAPSSLADGETYSTTITVSLAGLKNSLVTNELAVTADVKTAGGKTLQGEHRSASASVVIGVPPTGCFMFDDAPTPDAFGHVSGAWDNKSGVLNAIAELNRSAPYMARLCNGGTINLYRVLADYGGGSVSSAHGIFLYNAGVAGVSAIYTLAHESGHILSYRTGLFQEFYNEGIFKREGYIWTYPNAYTEQEDFAETFGAYVVYKRYVFRRRGTELNFLSEYPLHYDFAKRVFGIEY